MLTCTEAARLIARAADDPAGIGDTPLRELDAHVAMCAPCRGALDEQRQVTRILHMRPHVPVPAGFQARLASRIDAESAGWLGLANWRAWTVGLAPVAAALVLVAWLGPAPTDSVGDVGSPAASVNGAAAAPITFDTWVRADAGSASAAVFLEPAAGGDALLEAILTEGGSAAGDPRDVR